MPNRVCLCLCLCLSRSLPLSLIHAQKQRRQQHLNSLQLHACPAGPCQTRTATFRPSYFLLSLPPQQGLPLLLAWTTSGARHPLSACRRLGYEDRCADHLAAGTEHVWEHFYQRLILGLRWAGRYLTPGASCGAWAPWRAIQGLERVAGVQEPCSPWPGRRAAPARRISRCHEHGKKRSWR